MSNASHSPFSPSSFLVVLTIVIHLQILKIQTILMTGHLIHTRQTTLLVNSSSPIQAPRNGACFFFFFHSRTSMAFGNGLYRVFRGDTPRSPLQYMCRSGHHPET